jgi:prepilin-type processing-associated H-X9-DG protein
LKQIGLAMHNYVSAGGGFPPAKIWSGSCSTSNGGQGLVLNTTAFTLILNFMEQTPLYNAYNFSQASSNEAWYPYGTAGGPANQTLLGLAWVNTTVVGSMVASYVCPSDIVPSGIQAASYAAGNGPYSMQNARESNYLVSSAVYTEYECPGIIGTLPTPNAQGMFYNDISVDFAKVRDGTSNTFLAGESLQAPGHHPAYFGPYWGSGTHTSTHGAIYPPSQSNAGCNLPNGPAKICNPGYTGPTALYPYAWVFSSRHPGGVNMGFADGSVHFIKNTISIYIWWGLATIYGGEILSSDSY